MRIRKTPDGVVFKVLVLPRSSKNMIAGIHDEALKIKLTAPPVDNAANQMCLKFLAKSLRVSRSALEIITGHNSRHKQILLRPEDTKISANEYKHLVNLIENLAAS
ncbi:MAG: YggU family protein [Proteobacteria bacterium]|nr:YggU family protein [Pseudomonadota bacterium]